jgi:hypothetical protein
MKRARCDLMFGQGKPQRKKSRILSNHSRRPSTGHETVIVDMLDLRRKVGERLVSSRRVAVTQGIRSTRRPLEASHGEHEMSHSNRSQNETRVPKLHTPILALPVWPRRVLVSSFWTDPSGEVRKPFRTTFRTSVALSAPVRWRSCRGVTA